MSDPKCFISYSWDSSYHKDWVRSLAEKLHQNGVYTFLDQWDLSLGAQLPKFMETSIRESDFIVLVCTKNFAAKADAGKGGVGYEKNIVTGEMFSDATIDTKFVALLREGDPKTSLPSYLKSKLYLDFRDDAHFEANFAQLLRHIYREPEYIRPPLGTKPKFGVKTLSSHGLGGDSEEATPATPVSIDQTSPGFPTLGSHKSHDGIPFEGGIRRYLDQNYDELEALIKWYGAHVIRRKDRSVVVYFDGRTITYHRPKRKAGRLVSKGLLKELERLFLRDEPFFEIN